MLAKLTEIGSDPFLREKVRSSDPSISAFGDVVAPLLELLDRKNGFAAFEQALLVLPSRATDALPGLGDWNDVRGWKRYYGSHVQSAFFFAQDLFCSQFGVDEHGVVRLEPESGELAIHSRNLEEWAAKVLGNYDLETGWSLAHEWQLRHGPLPIATRLLGRQPFVMGGDYVLENLAPVDVQVAAQKLGHLHEQIRDVPDGKKITVRGWL
jgi:hypothetical protein